MTLENPSFARPFLNIPLLQNLQIIDSFYCTFSKKLVELKGKIVEAVLSLLPLLISSFLFLKERLWACLHGGGEPQIDEVTCGWSPHLSCKRDSIKMRDYMDGRVTPPKRVTSPTWGLPPLRKKALCVLLQLISLRLMIIMIATRDIFQI